MALTDILSLVSPAAGFAGALIQKGLGIWEARLTHRNKMEELELMSRIDVQKADINLRQTREDHAGAAFTGAINAQAGVQPASVWAKNVVALFRPGLTSIALFASIGHASYLLLEGADSTLFWQGIHSLASMSYAYWFGIRTIEKADQIRLAAPIRK